MNDYAPMYGSSLSAAEASAGERTQFLRLTYLHLAGAILAFMGLEALILNLPVTVQLTQTVLSARWGWVMVMGAFMVVSWVADSWARSSTSRGMQYAGLGLYVAAEAVIMAPLLLIANQVAPGTIPQAAFLTLFVFGGLTLTVLLTKTDFSFLGPALSIFGFAALGVFLAAVLFGFSLPATLFSGVMVVFASGCVLYHTSNVQHHYSTNQYVAAALALFASVALMFWYILQLLMSLQRR